MNRENGSQPPPVEINERKCPAIRSLCPASAGESGGSESGISIARRAAHGIVANRSHR
jgi:hypothetical protein